MKYGSGNSAREFRHEIMTQKLQIQSYSYQDRQSVVPVLMYTVTHSGGWICERRTLSPMTVEFSVEIELRGILDLYAGIIGAGLEMTRSGHKQLTEMCMYRRHPRLVDPAQTVMVQMEVSFLEEANLDSLLMTGASLA
jgi:hypothetical protein